MISWLEISRSVPPDIINVTVDNNDAFIWSSKGSGVISQPDIKTVSAPPRIRHVLISADVKDLPMSYDWSY